MGININRFKIAFDALMERTDRGQLPVNKFNALLNMAQRQAYKNKIGNPEEYQYGRPLPRTGGVQVTQKISDDLAPFQTDPIPLTKTGLFFQFPSGTSYMLSVDYINTSGEVKPVERVNRDEVGVLLKNSVVTPTFDNPIYEQFNKKFKVYPASINKVSSVFYNSPPDAIWAYTIINDAPVYDSTKSVDLLWDDEMFNELISNLLSLIGMSLKDGMAVQYAETAQNKGI